MATCLQKMRVVISLVLRWLSESTDARDIQIFLRTYVTVTTRRLVACCNLEVYNLKLLLSAGYRYLLCTGSTFLWCVRAHSVHHTMTGPRRPNRIFTAMKTSVFMMGFRCWAVGCQFTFICSINTLQCAVNNEQFTLIFCRGKQKLKLMVCRLYGLALFLYALASRIIGKLCQQNCTDTGEMVPAFWDLSHLEEELR